MKGHFFLADLEGEVTFYSVLINYLKVLSTDFLCITPTFWSFENASSLHIMALRVVGFLSWGYKIRNIFPKNQHTQRKLLYFENWVNGGGVKKCKITKPLDFQSQFSISKIVRIFLNFFSLKNINLGAHLLLFTFFDNIIF